MSKKNIITNALLLLFVLIIVSILYFLIINTITKPEKFVLKDNQAIIYYECDQKQITQENMASCLGDANLQYKGKNNEWFTIYDDLPNEWSNKNYWYDGEFFNYYSPSALELGWPDMDPNFTTSIINPYKVNIPSEFYIIERVKDGAPVYKKISTETGRFKIEIKYYDKQNQVRTFVKEFDI